MIAPTENDIGRRVRNKNVPNSFGVLVDLKGCGNCSHSCCNVRYEKYTVPTWPEFLAWADEDLL